MCVPHGAGGGLLQRRHEGCGKEALLGVFQLTRERPLLLEAQPCPLS